MKHKKEFSKIKKPFYSEVITHKTWAMTHAYVSNKDMSINKACVFLSMLGYGFAYKVKVKSSANEVNFKTKP